MMKPILTEEVFCKAIDSIEEYWNTIQKMEEIMGIDFCNSIIIKPIDSFLDFISEITAYEREDWENDITYYCWELNFGKNWRPGTIYDKDGNDIPLRNSKDLWNMVRVHLQEKKEKMEETNGN